MYGVNNVNHSPFNYGKKSHLPAQNDQQKDADGKVEGRKDEILFSSVSRKDESYLSSLSKEAKDYLGKLKEMYPDYDFIIADYETDEDASRLLSRGKGEINVLITPDLLEKMATDETTRAKYENIIAGAADQFDEIKENLTDDAKSMVKSLGITIDSDGNVNFFAKLFGKERDEDGGKTIKSGLLEDFANMLNEMAEARAKRLEEKKEAERSEQKEPDPPRDEKPDLPHHHGPKKPDHHIGKSELDPPKGVDAVMEHVKEKVNTINAEKRHLDTQHNLHKTDKKDLQNSVLPPKSFEKYKKENHGGLPPESFKKYQDEDMNFKV